MKTLNINQPVGIALGSGSARGLAHIGVLKELEEAGIQVGYIAGTSIGAIIGGSYAAGISVTEMEEIARELDWKKSLRLFRLKISKTSIISDLAIMDFLDSLYGDLRIEDLCIPFCVVAADLITGSRVVITKGKLADAVRASISIPIVFRPARLKGRILIDGGFVDPVPVEAAQNLGAPVVVAVPLTKPSGLDQYSTPSMIAVKKRNTSNLRQALRVSPIIDRLSRFFHADTELSAKISNDDLIKTKEDDDFNLIKTFWKSVRVAERELTSLRLEATPPDIIIHPAVEELQPWEYYKADEAIAAGEEAVKKVLQAYNKYN